MARKNRKAARPRTHEGAPAQRINPTQQLERLVMSCLLWEDEFYVDGQTIAQQIEAAVERVSPVDALGTALLAREEQHLRHVPLWVARAMARLPEHKAYVAAALRDIIQRPDELTEFLALYWQDGRQPLSAQTKRGLAAAFTKFDEYALAKYNRDGAVKLRDVLFLSHAKPKDEAQAAVWKRLVEGKLATPDTWEVALSEGEGAKTTEEKRARWKRLLAENKLGALALIRNLRNFEQMGVDPLLVRNALDAANVRQVLPFRFIAAARHAPRYEPELEQCLFRSLAEGPKLAGATVVLVDVSESMNVRLSGRSEMGRMDAASGLAMVLREVCEDVAFLSFSSRVVPVPPRRGMALRDALVKSQPHHGTYLGEAVKQANAIAKETPVARIVAITDEQSHDRVPDPVTERAYMLNVASNRNGVGYGRWTHVDGWSDAIVKWMVADEGLGEEKVDAE